VNRSNLPNRFQIQLAGGYTGDPTVDARVILNFAIAKDVNPADVRYTTVGSILKELLDDVGLDNYQTIVAVIVAYNLYRDQKMLAKLKMRYLVPDAAEPAAEGPEIGPPIDWRGPTDAVELQAFTQPAPDLLDVGFLRRALEATPSVCRIENSNADGLGTGFMVAPGLVLTNYHVPLLLGPDIEKNAAQLVLRFGAITAKEVTESNGQTFRLQALTPVVKSSPIEKLDYVLLHVEEAIRQAEGIKSASIDLSLPKQGMGLHILQHPAGQSMKLALSNNGVTGVFEAAGLVQYMTSTRGGSSGSPCFNDEWKVVALHHSERARMFGTVREGIIFRSIHAEIADRLSAV